MKTLSILTFTCVLYSTSAEAGTCIPPTEVLENLKEDAKNESSCTKGIFVKSKRECDASIRLAVEIKVNEWCKQNKR